MLLEAWETQVAETASATILPDGCQDLLFTAYPGLAPRWEITSLDDTAYRIEMPRGTYFKGFRLRAGVGVDVRRLCAALQGLPPDHAGIVDRLHSFSTLNGLAEETLSALQEQACAGGNVAKAAARLGVQQRQIQRIMARHTGRTAAKWLALARVRTAARALAKGGNLAGVAHDCGYADQPHMHRAFRQWLGTTPAKPPALSTGYG